MSILFLIIVILVCILVTGFFSGSEMALVHADIVKLDKKVRAGNRGAIIAKKLLSEPARFFSITLLGENLSTVTASVVTTYFIYNKFGEEYVALAIFLSPITLVFAELAPKSLYQHYANHLIMRVAPLLEGFGKLFSPVVKLLSRLVNVLLSRAKEQNVKDEGVGRDGLELMLNISEEALTDVRPNERTMINKVFNLAEKTAENIMTPLVDVVSISADTRREEVVKIFEEQSCSRLPVYERYVYNVIGVLEDIDMLFSAEYVPIRNLIKDSIYIPESMPLDELLITMKRKGAPMAIVVDEYGAATGIISIEDILEEVVGEIQDEFDFEPPKYRRIGHKHYLASGRMEIEKINEKLKLEIPSGDYETLAGFLLENFEKIPKVGDSIEINGWKYTVTKSSHKAIEEVDIRKGS